MDAVILKKGREKVLDLRHHWIFSGAVKTYPKGYSDGELIPIRSSEMQLLGWGFFNRKCSLVGRVVSFGENDVYESLKSTLLQALKLREPLLNDELNTACRLVNGEADGLPGLIVDKYGPYLVVQTGALGMRKLLPYFCELLRENLSILGIYEKSTGSSLKEEGLEPQQQLLWGTVPDTFIIKENGIPLKVSLKAGQKTGFFLDQREMRKWVATLSHGKRVLNGFCYTGGFTLAALKGGATQVTSVDVSLEAMVLCKENVLLSGFPTHDHVFYHEDMFDFLTQRECDFDLVILDPPAFAKKKRDIPAAMRGYKKLFELAMQKMPKGSLLLVSSCSYYISEELFESCVYEAALAARRSARIIGRHRHALDHPINLFHPESSYLKSVMISL